MFKNIYLSPVELSCEELGTGFKIKGMMKGDRRALVALEFGTAGILSLLPPLRFPSS
jgi:hypothetical protein